MKIQPRFYPFILIAAYLLFLLLGFLLGFLPERGGGHGRGILLQYASLISEIII